MHARPHQPSLASLAQKYVALLSTAERSELLSHVSAAAVASAAAATATDERTWRRTVSLEQLRRLVDSSDAATRGAGSGGGSARSPAAPAAALPGAVTAAAVDEARRGVRTQEAADRLRERALKLLGQFVAAQNSVAANRQARERGECSSAVLDSRCVHVGKMCGRWSLTAGVTDDLVSLAALYLCDAYAVSGRPSFLMVWRRSAVLFEFSDLSGHASTNVVLFLSCICISARSTPRERVLWLAGCCARAGTCGGVESR